MANNIPDKVVEIQFTEGVWTDVTDKVRKSITTKRGSSRIESPVIRYEPGHAKVTLDNRDRRFDPTNLQGPYVANGRSLVTTRKPLRVKAIWNGTYYPVFYGYVDIWDVDWTADVYSETEVQVTDGFKILSNVRRGITDPPVGDKEDSGTRVDRILSSAGWSVSQRVISTGNTPMQATDLSGNALEELQSVAESEVGELYMDASGRVVFRNRHALFLEERSNSVQFEFGTYTGQAAPYDFRLNTDDATLWNEVRATRINGIEQFVEDTASKVTYFGPKTFDRKELYLRANSTAHGYASWIVFISKDPEVRFDSITIFPMADPHVLFPQVLGREIGDRIRITRRPVGGGLPIVREVFIRGISHVIEQARWVTTFALQSATDYGKFFTLDDSVLGILGSGYPMVF